MSSRTAASGFSINYPTPIFQKQLHLRSRGVTTGDNSFTGEGDNGVTVSITGFPAARGWDPATGLGTPKANRLVPVLGGKLP